jgi:hypothetical protein
MILSYSERLILEAACKVCNDVCRRACNPDDEYKNIDLQAAFGLAECELLEALHLMDIDEIPFDAVPFDDEPLPPF